MLLTTTAAISGVAAKKNVGTVVMGGAVPASDRVTTFPSFIVTQQSGLLGNQSISNYINNVANSGLYLASGSIGGTLARDDRDDAIIYYSQKRDLAGVANTALAQSIAGPIDEPHSTVSGSYTLYGSGYSLSGTPLSAPSVGGESYGSTDNAAVSAGHYVIQVGGISPTSGNLPSHV